MGATDSRYTPVAEDIGYELIAEVGYTDGHGPGEKALSPLPVPPKVVVDVPSAPGNLQAAPRDRSVLLTWESASDNGSALTRYEYQQSTDGGTTWSPGWTTIALPADTDAADLTEHTVTGLTNGTVYTFEVRAVNAIGEGAAAQVTLPPENLRARWVFAGSHLLANNKAQLTWDDPDDDRITGWDYRQKAGAAAWGSWQQITGSSATTVTHSVEAVQIWRPYRFQVQARYGPGTDDTGPESAEAVLTPLPVFTQPPAVIQNSGDGKAQFKVGFDFPVGDVDLPDGLVPNEYIEMEVTKTTAAGVTTVSDWTALSQQGIDGILSGVTLVAEFTDGDLAPTEGLAGGGTGPDDPTVSRQVVAVIRVSGLDPGATYEFKVRFVHPDGVTELEPASASVYGLRWQRPTATAVALSWTDPNKPFIRTWQYRQRAGSGSWELWQNVSDPGATTTTHLVSGLEAEETYEFQVRALVPGGPLAESFTVSAAPKPLVAPANLRADPGHASMTLGWDDANNARLTGWQYQQRQAGEDWGAWQPIPGSTASTTSYTVPDLTNGVSYRFRVRALAGSQEGPFGKSVGGPPNGLRAQALNGAVELVWADPSDSRIAGWQYRVREGQDSWSGWQPVPGSTASTTSYTVPDLTNGVNHRFRVRGVASNGGVVLAWPMVETSPDGSLAVPPPVPVTNGPPEITSGPSAVSFDENVDGVVATYTGTDPDSDALTWTLGGADADTMEIDASGRLSFREPPPDFESPGDMNGDKIYEVTVSLSDGRPDAAADTTVSVRVSVTDVNEAPVVSGVSDTTFAEKGSGVVATYAATDPEGTPITWLLGGADADTMRLDASGRLRFRAPPPDYESPGDANADTVYEVTVTAGDGSLSSPPFPVRVSLTNVDEAGTVILPSSPQEGLAFTAILTDPDGDVSARHEEGNPDDGDGDGWVFERRDGNGRWQLIPAQGGASGAVSSLPELKSYTPTASDVGHLLRARVSYGDGHGPNKSAQSEPTGPVTAAPPPPPPGLPGPEGGSAVSGWAQARVSWRPVSASPAVSGYDVHWQSKPVSGGTWPESWTSLLDNGAGTVEEGARRAHVHPALDPDRVYRYRVRARRGQETGGWSGPLPGETGVQPQPGPATGVTAARGDRQVRLAWTGPDHAHLSGWQYRSGTVVGPDTTWASWRTMSGSGASTRDYTVPNRTNGRSYTFRVRALNAAGQGAPSEATSAVTPAAVPSAPGNLGAAPGDGDRQMRLSWERAADNGSALRGYQYRQSTDGGATWAVDWRAVSGSDATTTSHVLRGLSPGAYTFEVRALNGVGEGVASDRATGVWFEEKGTGAAVSYPSVAGRIWTRSGVDAGDFTLSSAGVLGFGTAPDFEEPVDADTDNVYRVRVEARESGAPVLRLEVVVRVTNVDEAGTVTLSPTARVGQDLTASLSDPDGGEQVTGWTWYARTPAPPGGASGAVDEEVGTSKTIRPSRLLIGKRLRARVRADYTDAHGPDKQAAIETAPVIKEPSAPRDFEATPGNGQVSLRWSAPSSTGGSAIRRYEHRHRRSSARWPDEDTWTGVGTATRAPVPGLSNDTTYAFQVRAVNEAGDGPAADATATPRQPNRTPTLTGPATASFAENGTGTVATYTASDPDGHPIAWSLVGDDAGAFGLGPGAASASRQLIFRTAPDYEARSSPYQVTVKVKDAPPSPALPDSTLLEVTVSVANVDEVGSVSLTTTNPKVGQTLVAVLTDPDQGVTGVGWTWQPLPPGPSGSGGPPAPGEGPTGASQGATSGPYTVKSTDFGLVLRVRADYTDAHGPGKQAASAESDLVVGVPSAPRDFEATPGNGQVSLRWSAPSSTGGSAISRYEHRHRRSSARWPDEDTWTGVGTATRATVPGLSNDTTYAFQVRAVNEAGDGPAADATATPRQPNRAPVLEGPSDTTFAENGTGSVATYTGTDADDDVLTWSKGGPDGGSFRLTGSGPTRTLEFHTAPDYEAKSSYRVTVSLSDGKARPVSVAVTVTVTDVNEPPVITGPVTKSVPENSAPVATYTATDPEGDSVTWSRAGTDGNRFQITESGGALRFSPAPDYEGPTDATWVNTYQVTVTATDNGSPNKSATRAVTVTDVNEPPPTPSAPSVSAASSNGHERLSVSWSAPSISGRPRLSDYDVQYRKSGASRWSAHSFTGTGTSTTISGLSTDTEYQVQVLAKNAEGSSSWSSSGRGRTRPNTAPSFTSGPTSKSVPENSTSVATYTATDPEGDSVTWSREGTDGNRFQITGGGALRFLRRPTTRVRRTRPGSTPTT